MVNEMQSITIGVLALQGSFSEHIEILSSLRIPSVYSIIPVRTPVELAQCRALVIPGGESTTMSLVAQRGGMLEPLREFVRDAKEGRDGKSVYGTCAGMILLGQEVVGAKVGYEGLKGVDVRIVRNQWGRQAESFSHQITIPSLSSPSTPYNAIFIRAPVVHSLLDANSTSSTSVQVLARVPRELLPTPSKAALASGASELGPDASVVMLRQGGLLITSFHPELTGDTRIHEWWCRSMVLGEQ